MIKQNFWKENLKAEHSSLFRSLPSPTHTHLQAASVESESIGGQQRLRLNSWPNLGCFDYVTQFPKWEIPSQKVKVTWSLNVCLSVSKASAKVGEIFVPNTAFQFLVSYPWVLNQIGIVPCYFSGGGKKNNPYFRIIARTTTNVREKKRNMKLNSDGTQWQKAMATFIVFLFGDTF